MKRLTRSVSTAFLFAYSSFALAVTESGTGQPQAVEDSASWLSWLLSLLPF